MRIRSASKSEPLATSHPTSYPPPVTSPSYSPEFARIASSILYLSPLPSPTGHPIYILNSAALPDVNEVDYNDLLPYTLARLPGEDELIEGKEYEIIFFAGGGGGATFSTASSNASPDGQNGIVTAFNNLREGRKNRPGWGWYIQAYHVLSRATRKRCRRLYIVHERSWVRILVEMFSTIVSGKFRRKIVHVPTLSALAIHTPIDELLIPPSAYIHDRRLSPSIHVPYKSGRRAFAARRPLPLNKDGSTRLPRVLRETTTFLLMEPNVQKAGIFRISPHAKLLDALREAYDRGQQFIVWKDVGTMLPIPGWGDVLSIFQEIELRDSYDTFMAAALIKTWYRELREPLFPVSSYQGLKNIFGEREKEVQTKDLIELISPKSQWSLLPPVSREILTRHLLPLASVVASNEEYNKMSAENLAIVFAPALVCGPDQMQDAKMTSVIKRILEAAILRWDSELRDACEVDAGRFKEDLEAPEDSTEYEDPLDDAPPSRQISDETDMIQNQFSGIILQDNDVPDPHEGMPPPLPPRRPSEVNVLAETTTNPEQPVSRRKPAPPLEVPPRYSTVITESTRDHGIAESPTTYATTTDGFRSRSNSQYQVATAAALSGSTSAAFPADEKGAPTQFIDHSALPPLVVPKRKALTAEQIENAEPHAGSAVAKERRRSGSIVSASTGTASSTSATLSSWLPDSKHDIYKPSEDNPWADAPASSATPSSAETFAKPTWPASARSSRAVSTPSQVIPAPIHSLARPIQAAPPILPPRRKDTNPLSSTTTPTSVSSTLPPPLPERKVRAPSPGLLNRIGSFQSAAEASIRPSTSSGLDKRPSYSSLRRPSASSLLDEKVAGTGQVDGAADERLAPKRLDMRKKSVDDLRRIYEERVGASEALKRVASGKSTKSTA